MGVAVAVAAVVVIASVVCLAVVVGLRWDMERGRFLVAGRTSFFLTNCQCFCFWQIKSVHEKLVCSFTYHSTLALYICIYVYLYLLGCAT